MDLRIYDGKIVRITDIDGETFAGFADYHDAENNSNGISSLSVIIDGNVDKVAYDFEETDIASVEIIRTHVMSSVV